MPPKICFLAKVSDRDAKGTEIEDDGVRNDDGLGLCHFL